MTLIAKNEAKFSSVECSVPIIELSMFFFVTPFASSGYIFFLSRKRTQVKFKGTKRGLVSYTNHSFFSSDPYKDNDSFNNPTININDPWHYQQIIFHNAAQSGGY